MLPPMLLPLLLYHASFFSDEMKQVQPTKATVRVDGTAPSTATSTIPATRALQAAITLSIDASRKLQTDTGEPGSEIDSLVLELNELREFEKREKAARKAAGDMSTGGSLKKAKIRKGRIKIQIKALQH